MKKILLALDLDNFNADLVAYTLEMAKALEAKVFLLHVAANLDAFIGFDEGPEYIRLDLAKELREEHRFLQRIAAEVKNYGVDAEALLINGDVAPSILEQAASVDASLLVLGMNEHGFFSNVFGGNTALEVLKEARIPVLCYPLGRTNT